MTTPQPSEFDSAAGSRMLGTNGLQEAINNLTSAVRTNTDAIKQSSGSAPGGTATPVGTTGQSITYGSFPRMSPAASLFQGSGAGSAANYATTPTGGQGNGQGGWGNPQSTLQSAGSSLMSGVQGMFSPGGSSFSNRITMNQFASMSTLGMGPGSVGAQQQAMYQQAFGRYGQNLNAIALNSTDAAQGYSTLQSIAANPYVNATALGRGAFSAYAGAGYANPSLGAAGSAQFASQLYSGQTSMMMRQLGYGATPRAGMGQANPMQSAQVAQAMLQRWYGKGNVNQNTLNAGLAQNGRLQLNLQALGLDPSTAGPWLQMYNKLFNQGVSATQANTLLNDAAKNQNYNGQSAQKILSNKYGIATSDLQKLKDTTAQQTSTTSGTMSGFDSAISGATTAVQKFEAVLNHMLGHNGGILGKISGYSSGFGGTMGSVGGTLGGLFSAGMGMLSGIFGGAGSGPPGGGSSAQGGRPGSSMASMSGQVSTAIRDAEGQLGRPYVLGGSNPATGFDCSGLVEWAYGQAGVRLPRTSQEQWAALSRRSVSLSKVRAGDIVFAAGADGTYGSPGHEALMISNNQIIEAPYTGANIRIRAYDPAEWQHAGRPVGGMTGAGGGSNGGGTGGNGKGSSSSTTSSGNAGLGLAVGSYGSSNEVANIQAALLGGGLGGGGSFGASSAGNGSGSAAGPNGGNMSVSTAGGGSAAANRALGKKMAAQMYGWVGSEWNALDSLWGTYESGWRNNAQNPGSSAYGIAQFLNSTWGPYGPKTSNPGLQIKYGLEYVHDRYKDPIHALQFELSHTPHWYADGTDWARSGMALVGERGPELVRLSGGQQVLGAGKTKDILSGQSAKPQATGSVATIKDLYLSPTAQNSGHGKFAGKCEVNLIMPAGAIVIHSNGTAADVSSNIRTIMQGVSEAMADNEMVQKIMAGVMG